MDREKNRRHEGEFLIRLIAVKIYFYVAIRILRLNEFFNDPIEIAIKHYVCDPTLYIYVVLNLFCDHSLFFSHNDTLQSQLKDQFELPIMDSQRFLGKHSV